MIDNKALSNSIRSNKKINYAKDKNKKPPQGFYFGYADSAFDNEIRHKKELPGVGDYDIESFQKSSKIHKKKVSNMPQTKRFIEQQIFAPPSTHYFKESSSTLSISKAKKSPSKSKKSKINIQQEQKKQTNLFLRNMNVQSDIIDEQLEINQNSYLNKKQHRLRDFRNQSILDKSQSPNKLQKSRSSFSLAARNTASIFINKVSVGPGKYTIDSTIGKSFESTAPNFKLYEGKKDITRYSTGGDSPGVGKYSLEKAESYWNAPKGGVMLKEEKNTWKSLILSQNLNYPGVGSYQSDKMSVFGNSAKGGKFADSERKFVLDQILHSKKSLPGPGIYNIYNEAGYKYKNSQGQSMPKFKTELFSSHIDYEPSPHDYHHQIKNYQKSVGFTQQVRQFHEKVEETPGVGTYQHNDSFSQSCIMNNDSIVSQQITPQLQKLLIVKKQPQIIVDEFGDERKQNDRAKYVKKRQLLEYGSRKQIDPNILEKYLKKKMSVQDYNKLFQPTFNDYNYDINKLQGQKNFNVKQNYQGSDIRRNQYLDVYGKPEFQPRSQGPALHGKILPIQDNGVTIPCSEKVSFVPPPRIKAGVGDYNIDDDVGFSHADKVNDRKQKFIQQNQALQEYLRQRDFQNQLKSYNDLKKKELEKKQEYLMKLG